jgi:hypothetical protein
MSLFKTLQLRTPRNRVMAIADSTPAASFAWTTQAINDITYSYAQLQLTGVNKQITLQINCTNPTYMSVTAIVQGANSATPTQPYTSYTTSSGVGPSFTINPGQYLILKVDNSDVFGFGQTTTVSVLNKSSCTAAAPSGVVVSTFDVTLIPVV